jgi:ATP-dependent helicase HrpB
MGIPGHSCFIPRSRYHRSARRKQVRAPRLMPMIPLPIDSVIPEALAHLRGATKSLVLVAEPGAGKTTRVPPAIVKERLLPREHPNLVLLQPRRVAARAAAQRIADENGWTIGREVGYQIRFERKISADTRLHVMTEGVLTRQLLDDPYLEGVGCVVLDEFHERSLHTDLAVALLREIRQTVRPDLMIAVMSATLEAEPVARFMGNAPIVRSAGRTFPVDISHAGATPRIELPQRIARLINENDDDDGDGDVLVFLPGVGEINRTMDAIEASGRCDDLVLPLHGSLSGDEQFAALKPSQRRKIVVATNIAETSLTIDGVTTVIDSGLARVAGFDPQRGMDRLELKRISRASATQRAGRAGRTRPGKCIRLWSAIEDKSLEPFESPEVRRVDLTQTVLALHAWGHSDPRKFEWYEPPDERAIAYAEQLLEMLGATTSERNGKITDVGRKLLSLPAHPRVGRLLLAAAKAGMLRDGAAIAALLSEKDILRTRTDLHPSERRPTTQGPSDLLIRLDVLESRRRDHEVDQGALRQALQARDELERVGRRLILAKPGASAPGDSAPGDSVPGAKAPGLAALEENDALLHLPLFAYPDRVCRRRGSDPASGVMVGGGGVRLAPESVVRQHEFFLALDARQDQRNLACEAIVRIASGIDVAWLEQLFPQEIRRERTVVFDEQRQLVVGRGATYYRDLPLREDKDAAVDPEQASRVLAEALSRRAAAFFGDDAARNFLARVALLRQHMSEHLFPKFDDAELADVLADACAGKRSADEVRRVNLIPLLESRLPYPLDRILDQHAPETIAVPTGNRIRLDYSANGPPVLAVRLQELFGMTETPRIAGGRVPVRVHLLGPNYRPVQITDDLRSFWKTTYFQVRKDLRVRYPKHSWPEDPLTAKPEAKGGRRRA